MSPLHECNADVPEDEVFMVSVHLVILFACRCLLLLVYWSIHVKVMY
jgi:hypothetical protein